jgi:chitodextrinase
MASTGTAGVAAYDIYSGSSLIGSSASNSATVQNLLPGTTYTFSVKARDAAGNTSAASASVVVTTTSTQDVAPPSAPSNLAWVNDNGTVTISWAASTDNVGVVAYELYFGNSYLGSFEGTSLAMVGFRVSTPYVFTVRARDAANNKSLASNQITVIIPPAQDTTPPTVPGNLTALDVKSTSLTLRWTASTDNVGVVVYQVFANGAPAATVVGANVAVISNLSANSAYRFTVKAFDAANNSSLPSAELYVQTLSP